MALLITKKIPGSHSKTTEAESLAGRPTFPGDFDIQPSLKAMARV